MGLTVLGVPVIYDVAFATLSCEGRSAPLPLVDGAIKVQILVDRTSVEIFGNSGAIALPLGVVPPGADVPVSLSAEGDGAAVKTLNVFELASIWE